MTPVVPAPAAPATQAAAPAIPAGPPPRVLTGLSCPSCGGALEASEGWTNLVCRYCSSSLLVAGERGISRSMVLDDVNRARAEEALRSWLGHGISKAMNLARDARVTEAFLAWFPFVRARFDVIGWILGTVRRTKDKRTIEVPREVEVERSFDVTRPAADMAEFGVGRVELAGDRILPLQEETLRSRGMVFRAQMEPEEVSRASIQQGLEEVRLGASLYRTTFEWLRSVRERTTVVYYPLWVFRYVHRGRTYQALVDAQDGSLAFGQAPANTLVRALKMIVAVAGTCFAATTVLQSGACSSSDHAGGGLVALGIGVALAIAWGWRQFRYGSVIEEGTGLVTSSAPGGSLADRLRGLSP